MKSSTLDRDIRSRIDAFLSDVSQLVKSSALEAVRDALGGPRAAPRKRGPGRPPSAGAPKATGARAKRTSEDVQATADAFLSYVKGNEGQRLEQIAAGLGASTRELKLPVLKLLEAGALRTEGQKRGTKYYAGNGAPRVTSGKKRGRRTKKA